ncbi:MAG TPA: heparan-alpha-glucosaminide N-acetyltransferase domain-containing protein, partial [Candidatus Marinimicrobia bacterium]|nr:heparan-alpha-glucosaminide N-acetyltransferase domain-containing protein [Candidatus Neomarinimicrobiota bacterium]
MEHSKRIYSLDVFRGATIAAMILVNNAGSYDYVYPQLLHAEWHGWTFTDWIFPFFLFMVGMSMVFSFESRLKRGDTHQQILRHSLKRLLILFALGLFINGFPFGLIPGSQFSIATWRILGVLQRIGICYFFTSLIYLNVKPKGQWLWIGILLGIYWFALKVIPVPGYGAGVLEPEGNLAWFIDKTLLGKHTWAFAPVFGFDPEGILSTIPAIASTLLGVQAGRWLRSERSQEEKTAGMFVAGNLCLLLGIIMNIWLPINKNLWTSSYV